MYFQSILTEYMLLFLDERTRIYERCLGFWDFANSHRNKNKNAAILQTQGKLVLYKYVAHILKSILIKMRQIFSEYETGK
jgi:hypothetical protein